MKRFHTHTPFALLLLLLCVASVTFVSATPTGRAYFPAVRYPMASEAVVLVSTDTGLVNALVTSDGKIVVAYANRAERGKVHVALDTGGALVEIDAPMVARLDAAPAFSPEGEKQGGFSMVEYSGQLLMYFTSRDIGDTIGPFRLRRMSMPIKDL